MMRDLVAALRLIRLPNTLTALADVMAGAAVAGVDPLSPRVLVAAGGSALLYGGGIALNDLLDLDKDKLSAPERVLPSGALAPRTAATLATLLLLGGALSALHGSAAHGAVTIALVVAILAYDLLPDGYRFSGAVVMGTCRGLNLARGMTLAAVPMTQPVEWIAASAHCALILLVTVVSTFEGTRRLGGAFRTALLLMPLPYLVPGLTAGGSMPALVLGAGVGIWVSLPGWSPAPRPVEVVKRAIFTLVLFDALYALAADYHLAAVCLAALLPLIRLLARGLGQRGS